MGLYIITVQVTQTVSFKRLMRTNIQGSSRYIPGTTIIKKSHVLYNSVLFIKQQPNIIDTIRRNTIINYCVVENSHIKQLFSRSNENSDLNLKIPKIL